jgi:HK97 family phage prohead protease
MINYKSIETKDSIMDIDSEKRIVKAVWSRMGNVDLDNDMMSDGCYNRTIKQRGPSGSNQVYALVDHKASLEYTLGKPMELYVENDQLIAVTKITDTRMGEDVIKLYNAGVIGEHSVGFRTVQSQMNDKTGVRTITEVMLYEGSAVVWGANPDTPTLGMKSLLMAPPEDLVKRLDKLTAAFKSGTFTDDTFGLLEIEIKQIQTAISNLSTQPVVKTPDPLPENTALLDAIKYTNSQLKNLLK